MDHLLLFPFLLRCFGSEAVKRAREDHGQKLEISVNLNSNIFEHFLLASYVANILCHAESPQKMFEMVAYKNVPGSTSMTLAHYTQILSVLQAC
jgi:hypothetical protein